MIIDKEYPATHSMSTSWFAIDKDGKVALLDFNENGPVPNGTPEESPEYLIFEALCGGDKKARVGELNYTIDQAFEIEKHLKKVSIDDLRWENIVKVAKGCEQQFENLCMRNAIRAKRSGFSCVRLCYDSGLYIADFYEWDAEDLKLLIENGIVLKACELYFDTDCEWDDQLRKWVFSQDILGFPYYLYQQPYSSSQLMERTAVPLFPLSEAQLDPSLLVNALHLPISFDSEPYMQIAEFAQCSIYGEVAKRYEGLRRIEYMQLPFGNNRTRFVRGGVIGDLDCRKCMMCASPGKDFWNRFYITQYGLAPTIVLLYSPMDKANGDVFSLYNFYEEFNLELLKRIMIVPVIPAIADDRQYRFSDGLNELIDQTDLKVCFENCRFNFEEGLTLLNPYVVMLTDSAKQLLSHFYDFSGSEVWIGKNKYPWFRYDGEKNISQEVFSLSDKPYRGVLPARIVDSLDGAADVND